MESTEAQWEAAAWTTIVAAFLASPDPAARENAEKELRAQGPDGEVWLLPSPGPALTRQEADSLGFELTRTLQTADDWASRLGDVVRILAAETDPARRAGFLEKIALAATVRKAAVPLLARWLYDPASHDEGSGFDGAWIVEHAVLAGQLLSGLGKVGVVFLIPALDAGTPTSRRAAAAGFEKLGERAFAASESLVRAMGAPEFEVRCAVGFVVGKIARKHPDVADQVLARLAEPNDDVAHACLIALAEVDAEHARAAYPRLVELLTTRHGPLAFQRLVERGTDAESHLFPALVALGGDANPHRRLVAARFVARLGGREKNTPAALTGLAKQLRADPDPAVRAAMA